MPRYDVSINVFFGGMNFKGDALPTSEQIMKKLAKMPVKKLLENVKVLSVEKG